MTVEDQSSMQSLSNGLLNKSGNTPLSVRFRALFALKALAGEGSTEAVDIIAEGFGNFGTEITVGFQDESELLKHELAYVLGQTRNLHGVRYLENVLDDPKQQEIVRHEVYISLSRLRIGCRGPGSVGASR